MEVNYILIIGESAHYFLKLNLVNYAFPKPQVNWSVILKETFRVWILLFKIKIPGNFHLPDHGAGDNLDFCKWGCF